MEGKRPIGKEIAPVEQIPLKAIVRNDPTLAPIFAAGFTPKLPELMNALNVALTTFPKSPIKFIEIAFYPDAQYPIRPLIRTEFEEHSKVTLRMIPPKRAGGGAGTAFTEESPGGVSLSIGEAGFEGTLASARLNDLQELVRQLAPGKKAILGWVPQPTPGKDTIGEAPITEDFLALTQSALNKLPVHYYGLIIDGQPEPMFRVGLTTIGAKSNTVFMLSQFRFVWAGPAGAEAERAMELLSRFLDFKNGPSAPGADI